jgi:hypothetical protein
MIMEYLMELNPATGAPWSSQPERDARFINRRFIPLSFRGESSGM